MLGFSGRPAAARAQHGDNSAASPGTGAAAPTADETVPAGYGASPGNRGTGSGNASRISSSDGTHDTRAVASGARFAGKPARSPAEELEAAQGEDDALQRYGEWIQGDSDGQMQPGMEMMRQLEALIQQRLSEAVRHNLKDVVDQVRQQLRWRTLLPLARREGLDLEEVRLPPFRRHRRSCHCCLGLRMCSWRLQSSRLPLHIMHACVHRLPMGRPPPVAVPPVVLCPAHICVASLA